MAIAKTTRAGILIFIKKVLAYAHLDACRRNVSSREKHDLVGDLDIHQGQGIKTEIVLGEGMFASWAGRREKS